MSQKWETLSYGPLGELIENAGSERPDFSRVVDEVEHPSYYNQGKYEVLEVILDWGLGFLAGNVVKYLARAPHKGSELSDLCKARAYLERLIQEKLKEQ